MEQTIISQRSNSSQATSATSGTSTTATTMIPARRRSEPSSLFFSPSQISKYVYGGNLLNNDDEMSNDETAKLVINSKFHTTTMNQALDYIQKQCDTKYGKKMGFKLEDIAMILKVKRVFYNNKEEEPSEKPKIMSMLFDLIDIIHTGKNMDEPFFSPKRSLIEMNRPFSEFKEVVSIFTYNKYYINKFVEMGAAELNSYQFLILHNFSCQVMTCPDSDQIKQVNHYKWWTIISDSNKDNSNIRLLLNRLDLRKDRIFAKSRNEYPILYINSLEHYFRNASEIKANFDGLQKKNPNDPIVSHYDLCEEDENENEDDNEESE